jgi:GT2 family glycosyltransferase
VSDRHSIAETSCAGLVAAIVACHDRRETTLRCLRALFSQEGLPIGAAIVAVIVDDGSTDGTADEIIRNFPDAHVVRASGDLFWAAAMALGEREATQAFSPQFLLWLNDDVELHPGALRTMLATYEVLDAEARPGIVVGAVLDPETKVVTYSGVRRVDRHPLHYELVRPDGRLNEADTLNGNVVLVPHGVHATVGGIDGRFAHAQADFDYGLRARKEGFSVVVAPTAVGTCRRGGQEGTWRDQSLPVGRRWRLVFSQKGMPPRSYARYLRRHGGRAWPLWWISSYAKFALSSLRSVGPGPRAS